MKSWILDIIVGVAGLILFAIMMFVLPMIMPAAYGYIGALLVFIAFLTAAGLTVIKDTIS